MSRDAAARPAFLLLVRSPRRAFATPFLVADAAHGRARIARRRGWNAVVVEVDLTARDGTSLDPRDLPESDVEEEPAPPRRPPRRSRRGRLLADEAAPNENAADLNAYDTTEGHDA